MTRCAQPSPELYKVVPNSHPSHTPASTEKGELLFRNGEIHLLGLPKEMMGISVSQDGEICGEINLDTPLD